MAVDFSRYQAVLLDLDGTVYHDEQPLPGAVALIQRLHAEKRRLACLTNSTTSPMRIVARLGRMGIELTPDQVYSAAAATADYVLGKYAPRPRVYNLATEGVQEMLDGKVDWVKSNGEPCHAIIIGTSTNKYATEERQRVALMLARKGAELVGTSADRVYPSVRGIEFGAGALASMLAYAANTSPFFCGKPQKVFFANLCHRLDVQPDQCLLIGDNIESDIVGARMMGMATILTLTGVTRRRDLLTLPPQKQPNLIVEDLTELE